MAQPSTSVVFDQHAIESGDLMYLRRLQKRIAGPYELSYSERIQIAMSLEVIVGRIDASPLIGSGQPSQPQARSVQ